MKIVIEDDIFVTDNTHVVNTTFFLSYKNQKFPYDKWTDFTFPILEEWKYDLLRIKNAQNVITTMSFHDGPYWLNVHKDNKMNLKIECINDRKDRFVAFVIECKYCEFLESIYSTLKLFIKILYKNNMYIGAFDSVYKQSIISKNEIEEVLINLKKNS